MILDHELVYYFKESNEKWLIQEMKILTMSLIVSPHGNVLQL